MSSLRAASGGWAMLFPKPAVVVISGRYLRALHLRAEAFTANEQDAKDIADKAGAFLSLFHAAEISVGTQGTDVGCEGVFRQPEGDPVRGAGGSYRDHPSGIPPQSPGRDCAPAAIAGSGRGAPN